MASSDPATRSAGWKAARVLGVLLLAAVSVGQAQDPYAFWQREMLGFQRALRDPAVNLRVQGIWLDLVADTGVMLPVVPVQQFTLGQALPNGVVLLDLGVAGDPHVEVTAFWLAHEYAHQVLGHSRLYVTPVGRWVAAMSGTAQEDSADRWAGRFLRRAGYRVAPAIEFLCQLPSAGPGGAHSPGPTRARNVARSYGASTRGICPSTQPPRQLFCCDGWGNRRCPIVINPGPLGSSCFCPGQGHGVTCR